MKWLWLVPAATILLALVMTTAACASSPFVSSPATGSSGMMGGTTGGMTGGVTGTTVPSTGATANASIANGRSIYLYAVSLSGSPVTSTGAPSMMMQGPLACATCHGADGHGSTVYVMMRSYDAPDITWAALSGPDPDMEHPSYTVETLKRAITEGLDPGGSPLEYPMPRWQMSPSDLNDLVAYLMTLR